MLVVRALRYPTASFFTIAMGHLSFVMALLLARQQSLYYHITHDLNARTIRRLSILCRVFKKLVFISPATYREFSRKTGRRDRLSWTAQISELPPIDAKLLLAERQAKLAANPAIRFGLIGRLTEHKGAGEILRFIDGTAANCEFHVAGSGPFGNEFQRRHHERQAGSKVKVHFYGAYEPTERVDFLRTFFSNVDWLIVPTLDEWETLSMALLEGLQHGVPCLATRTGGLKSFEMPELGPAPPNVVRLVEPSEMGTVLHELALSARPLTAQIATACLDYYAAFFSNKAVGKQWLELAGCRSEDGALTTSIDAGYRSERSVGDCRPGN